MCSSCLEQVIRVAPGILEACYLLAKIKYLLGDNSAAQTNLNMCLEQDSTYANAHILMAQVCTLLSCIPYTNILTSQYFI